MNFVTAQNLVYNGDFELYDTCPNGGSSPGNYQIEHCLGWKAPTYGTSDYYNICAPTSSTAGIPWNFAGYQQPQSGNGYCGFFGYLLGGGGCLYSGNYWFEYIQGQLTTALVAGHQYEVSLHLSLGNSSNTAVSGIGCYFTNYPITTCNTAPLQLPVQVSNSVGHFLKDTSDWIQVNGTLIATGGERFLTIGNFRDTTLVDTFRVVEDNMNYATSYYLIDNVSVIDLGVPNQQNVFTPNDDGINDTFQLYGLLKDERYYILNRWGNVIFIGTFTTNWEGNDQLGNQCNEGVYFYLTETNHKTGFIQLLR